ncbi:hypothetical protein K458DRAFT_170339 [Lentithecium fluviatile CBS 122367]|uniref:Zn(2)-C6 fungal-type domain-containing protein n=1 Tax=Lentithecium fluviatile CBS 122367 TaxID=1168545 RepID=A0A6G1JCA4_9PLEO|nr:hypothetical protein K458DRAFT_170339 [Lentithecium fluviatile CBS 122367]
MESGDPDAPNHKRLRLDSGNPVLNGHPPRPPPPAQRHPSHPSHPTSTQASSPPPPRHYPPHSLPPPTYPSPGPSHFAPPQPSPSLPPSDIRHLSDPRNIPSPGHRTHGLPGTPVTLPARNNIPQDSISTYRPPPTPQSTTAPDLLPSRSTSFDAKPHMEPGPWPGNPDHRHGSISNGYSAAMSPPNPNEPPFHTPPLPSGQHYGQPPPGAYTPAPYMGQYVPGPGQMRRKQVRATQACNHCRARKQKCDEARPCQFCRENNFDCQYKDVPPPKQDRSMMALQDGISNISDTLQNFIDTFNVWKQSVESRLATRGSEGIHMGMDHASPGQTFAGRGSIGDGHSSRMPTPNQARSQLRRADSIKTESPTAHHSHVSPVAAYTSTPVDQKSILATPQPPATPADSIDHPLPVESAPRGLLEGLQSDHTTPAHLLLAEWPQMRSFCSGIPELEKLVESGKKISDYPMQFEQDRGLLRVWGVGEGNDSNDGAQGPSSPESNVDSDAPSPGSTKEGIWGYPPVDHSSPSTLGGETPRHYSDLGGLGPDGKPDFRLATLQSLRASYHEHIHCLHPFVNPSKLRKMVADFGAVYSPEAQKSRTRSPAGVPERLNPGIKRKRSGSVLGDSYGLADDLSKGTIERSLRNAIVLLVLALGKVCQHTESLPAPHADRNPTSYGNWGYTRDSPHSANHSFSSDDSDSRPRNIDVLPGMAYFSYATDILGNQQGGNTVAHAQAMLLAALYLSQFARVLESWSWINNACRVCLVLVKADYPKLSRPTDLMTPREPDPPKEVFRLNLVKCVYWTCLQLETDILAEMSTLPPTEVSKYQDDILYPSGVYEKFPDDLHIQDDSDDHILFIYSSLIHLRVVLNGAHNTLYGAKNRKTPRGYNPDSIRDVGSQVEKIVEILKIWRRGLPANLSWSDDDPPSTDINIARLRAKYYGGLYMVLRPVLRIAVKNLEPDPHRKEVPQDPVAENARYMRLIHECIESAIQSTIAFDRIGADPASGYFGFTSKRRGRLILTNIVGTLHAQFGNMIILAAVYKSPLQKYLAQGSMFNRTNLSILFHRTIAILEEVAPNSPILRMDLKILENARRELTL